jgi:5'-methylthioadenosine phosphorylase
MTTATEAKLAREAEMAYICVSMVTDVDSWSEAPHVDVQTVMQTLHSNAEKAQVYPPAIIEAIAKADAEGFDSDAFGALKYAVMTKTEALPQSRLRALRHLFEKYEHLRPRE